MVDSGLAKAGGLEVLGLSPGTGPVNPQDWGKTKAIGQALGRVLTDKDRTVRVVALTSMRRQGVPVPAGVLVDWLTTERDAAAVKVLQCRPLALLTAEHGVLPMITTVRQNTRTRTHTERGGEKEHTTHREAHTGTHRHLSCI